MQHPVTHLAAACSLALAAGSACAGGADGPSAQDPNPYAVHRAESVAPFFAAARSRRVDMAIIGDSNTRSASVSGHEDGMARGFAARLECYGTRVEPMGGWGSWGTIIFHSASYPAQYLNQYAPAHITAALGDLPLAGGFPSGYSYLSPGMTVPWTNNSGQYLYASHPMDISGPLRWHFTYYHWPAAAGADLGFVSPTVRDQWPGSAYVLYASASLTTSGPGVPGPREFALNVPSGERGEHGLVFCLTDFPGQRGARGPFISRWTRSENIAKTRGFAYSPLLYQGGRTARDAAISLLDLARQTDMTEWFRQATRLQNGPPMLLVQIIHGGNDANWPTPAVVYERGMGRPAPGGGWPAGEPTNTAAGMRQNFQSIINIMRDDWVGAGHDESNLFFVLGGYHPQPPYWNETAPGAGDGWQWRLVQHDAAQAWREICEANANVAMIDGYKLSTHEEFTLNAWYTDPSYPGGDQAHLSVEGYRAWGGACAEALLRACDCGPSVDFDADGRRTVADIFDFLAAWFSGEARADFDRSGGAPTPSDIFAFLNAWFSGCAGH
ncbi:MAG: hypothetical protein KF699_06850 [Phycisphaeraceae bacterium]|nr:hypothetical protein [Phycisphaeraceae bacterium]